jgi:glucuronokinase
MEKLGYGIYNRMDINLLPPLFLIYAENPSDSGKVRFVNFSLKQVNLLFNLIIWFSIDPNECRYITQLGRDG